MAILVVAPHPDDAEFGAGGSVAKWAKTQDVVFAICTGEGDLTMQHTGQTVKFAERQQEQERAAKILGVSQVLYLDLGWASQFDQTPQSKFVTAFDRLFPDFDLILIPRDGRTSDHSIVTKAAHCRDRRGEYADGAARNGDWSDPR
jgi:LmbE family N-acetylglucosaminyl deacetylase